MSLFTEGHMTILYQHYWATMFAQNLTSISTYGVYNGSFHIAIAQVFEVWNLGAALYAGIEHL